jgi:CSLREA domain-containing protein
MIRHAPSLRRSLALLGASLLVLGLTGATSVNAQEGPQDDRESSVVQGPDRREAPDRQAPRAAGTGAATITVTTLADEFNTGAGCSLREAVEAADTNAAFGGCPAGAGDDTIVLPAGTLTLSIAPVGNPDDNASGDIDVNSPVTIQGTGMTTTTINGANLDRVFDIFSGPFTAEISSLTITGASSGSGFLEAGAIWCSVDLTLRNVAMVNNTSADFGGAIACGAGSLTVLNSTFSGNEAATDGGAIWTGNTPLTISSSTITDNESLTDDGGGIAADDGGTVSLTNSTVSGNRADDLGGGLYVDGEATIVGSTISGNEAGDLGGGIQAITDSTVQLTNSTVSGNRAVASGGGVRLDGGGGVTLTILNTTITGNLGESDGAGAGSGGGISNGAPDNTATLKNTILAGNSVGATGTGPDCAGDPLSSQGNNIVGTTADCTFTAAAGDKVNTNPNLGPLADNGGPTMTHALLSGSPAIDGGGVGAPPTDQRGLGRVGPPDIGAYELAFCQKVPVNRIGTDGNDSILGTPGSDGVLAFEGNDTVRTKGGGDAVCAAGGKDKVKGGGGKDRVKGGPGKDTLAGQGGKDTLVGQGANDKLKGGGGKDKLKGGPGNDLHNGGPGTDTCRGGSGNNTFKNCE